MNKKRGSEKKTEIEKSEIPEEKHESVWSRREEGRAFQEERDDQLCQIHKDIN